jgi:hypothetical protein
VLLISPVGKTAPAAAWLDAFFSFFFFPDPLAFVFLDTAPSSSAG